VKRFSARWRFRGRHRTATRTDHALLSSAFSLCVSGASTGSRVLPERLERRVVVLVSLPALLQSLRSEARWNVGFTTSSFARRDFFTGATAGTSDEGSLERDDAGDSGG